MTDDLERIGYAIVASKLRKTLLGELTFDTVNRVFFLKVPIISNTGVITGHRQFLFQSIEAEIISESEMEQQLRSQLVPRPTMKAPPPRPIVPQIDPRDAMIERLMRELDEEKNKPPFPSHPPELASRPAIPTRVPAYTDRQPPLPPPVMSERDRLFQLELAAREERARNPPTESIDPCVAALNPDKYPDPDKDSPLLAVGRMVQGSSHNHYGTDEQARAIAIEQIPHFFNEFQDAQDEGWIN